MGCLHAPVVVTTTCCCPTNHLDETPPFREAVDPTCFSSSYSRFWSDGTRWEKFLIPSPYAGGHPIKGPAIDRTRAEPGIYEFGASMPQSPHTIVPLYVGKSSNLRQRHLDYVNDGSHLESLMQGMLSQNCILWQRIRYTATDLQSQRWEAQCLILYDCK